MRPRNGVCVENTNKKEEIVAFWVLEPMLDKAA
jgi:hypothetical protein